MARERNVKRIVVDSISAFETGMPDKQKYTDFIWGMADFFKTQGISLLLTQESCNLFGTPKISDHGISYIADNILLIQYIRKEFELHRFINVLKMRGSGHDNRMKELIIGDKGPVVLDRPGWNNGSDASGCASADVQ
ncbi:MAG: ATPase domain-containing protein [Bacillota bacterium]